MHTCCRMIGRLPMLRLHKTSVGSLVLLQLRFLYTICHFQHRTEIFAGKRSVTDHILWINNVHPLETKAVSKRSNVMERITYGFDAAVNHLNSSKVHKEAGVAHRYVVHYSLRTWNVIWACLISEFILNHVIYKHVA